jgi:AcrR family transcriptional regulator
MQLSSPLLSNDTRSRLVEVARQLFHAQGYQATSLAAISKRAGANAGSLYYFFRTKEELLVAVLERYVDLLRPLVIEPAFARSDNPIERIFAVLGRYRQMLLETGFEIGCPIGNLALEVSDLSPEVRDRISRNFANWMAEIESCLQEADGLPSDLDRRQLSRFILTVMEGAVVQARGYRCIEPFDESVAQLRDYFARLLGPGPEKSKVKDLNPTKEEA